MMFDEMNKLPTDPDWIKKVISQAEQAARELDCAVVLVAIQENGKMAVQVTGVPEAGPLSEIAKDPPRFLATLSLICMKQDEMQRKRKQ